MYMCPPHPLQGPSYSMPPRYPQQPYMGYEHPYLPNGGNREDYPPHPPPPSSSTFNSPPAGNPHILQSLISVHPPLVNQHTPPLNYPSTAGQSYHSYPPYMH
jgi:hypothetical protein